MKDDELENERIWICKKCELFRSNYETHKHDVRNMDLERRIEKLVSE